ncbi:hypothetical protein X801_03743, partial [Opisthorchis viverrini]
MMVQVPTNSQSSVTLIFKHFPTELTAQDIVSFLHSLGATNVNYLGQQGALKNSALADFPSLEHCWKVIRGVHQRTILEKRLCVEFFCPTDTGPNEFRQSGSGTQGIQPYPGRWMPTAESPSTPLAPKWDIWIPVSPNLHYKYPPATESILTNIVRTMVSCPAFYTQVLHLMNRLHLPPPFVDPELFPGTLIVTAEPLVSRERRTDQQQISKLKGDDELEMDLSTSTESELESDTDLRSATSTRATRTVRRARRERRTKPVGDGRPAAFAKRTRDNKLQPPNVSELFETPSAQPKLQLHVPQELPLQEKRAHTAESVGGFGLLNPVVLNHQSMVVADRTSSERVWESDDFRLRKGTERPYSSSDNSGDEGADFLPSLSDQERPDCDVPLSFSLDELRLRRLSPEERQNYAVFSKNYSAGEPTSRLYIKNLAPSVTEHDLHRVFGVFQFGLVKDLNFKPAVPSSSTDRFSIRLLTEGRMKGQAFVSLDGELTAAQALEATNGLLLHDRPMVVQFARGAKAKVDEKSLIQI